MRGLNQECDAQEPRQRVTNGEVEATAHKSTRAKRVKAQEINWQHWWPFDRATGTALRQLNRRQPKQATEQYEDAPL